MVCLQQNWAALKFRSQKTTFFLFVAEYVVLSFIAQNTCFYLFAVKFKFRLLEQKKVLSKNAFFCDIKLKAARFCCQHAKKRIFATKRLKKGYSEAINKIAVFCNKMLETSDFIANTAKHVFDKIKGQKHSLRRKTRKSLFSET